MRKISVIVPIYNSETTLPKCIESIVAQQYSNLEIVLVDDGSTDNSLNICNEYASRDERIVVHHKPNGGSVSARKDGVFISTGEYVTFVDSDDWWEKGYLEQCFAELEQYKPDIFVVTKFFKDGIEREIVEGYENRYRGIFHREKIKETVFPSMLSISPFFTFGIMPSLWTKIIRRELLEKAIKDEPEEIRVGDDLAVTLSCILQANTIYFSDICGYHYWQNPNSIMHTFDRNAPYRVRILLNYLREISKGYASREIDNQIAEYAVHITYVTLASLVKGSHSIRKDLKSMGALWKNPLVKKGLQLRIPYKIKIVFFLAKVKQIWALRIIKKHWPMREKNE